MSIRPEGQLASRPLHFIWILDTSGSMAGDGKIQALNNAIREALPHMQDAADSNPNAKCFVHTLEFNTDAKWVEPEPKSLESFVWTDIYANGVTNMGLAFSKVAESLKMPPMQERALPPVLVLISDGQPTDAYQNGLNALFAENWGKKAVRLAIGIGDDCDLAVLAEFIANKEIPVLQASCAEDLVNYIRWASTAVVKAASAPASQAIGNTANIANIPIPAAPSAVSDPTTNVW